MKTILHRLFIPLLALFVSSEPAHSVTVRGIELDLVTVGSANNAADTTTYRTSGAGAVAYDYQIGKYEITAAQWAAFLNQVDPQGVNTYSLWNTNQKNNLMGGAINNNGVGVGNRYVVTAGATKPIVQLTWRSAARFCNFLTSGNTEQGVYNTSTWVSDDTTAQANYGTIYFLPSLVEWYKAAFHKGAGLTGSDYWDYPHQSDATITNADANIGQVSPYTGTTSVGNYINASSAYGTHDQAGNAREWLESSLATDASKRLAIGGSYAKSEGFVKSNRVLEGLIETSLGSDLGFRIASVSSNVTPPPPPDPNPPVVVVPPPTPPVPPTPPASGSLLPLHSRIVYLGNSKDAMGYMASQRYWSTVFNAGRLYLSPHGNQARGGDTIGNFLSRWSAAAAVAPHIVVIGDATNDLAKGRTTAQVLADIDTLINNSRAIGARVALQLTPATSKTSGTAETRRQEINTALANRVATDVVLIDTPAIFDGHNSALTYDGVHPNFAGAFILGETIGNTLKAWTTSANVLPASGDLAAESGFGANINPFYDMAGTSGLFQTNITGQVANGWTADNDTGASGSAKKGVLNGLPCQIIDLTGTSTTSTADCRLFRSVPATLTAGDFYETLAEIEISATDDVSNPVGLGGFGIAGWGNIFSPTIQAAQTQGVGKKFSGLMRTTGVVTGQGSSSTLSIAFRVNVGAVDVRMKVGRVFIRKTEQVAYAVPYNQNIPGDGNSPLYKGPIVGGTISVGQTASCSSGDFSGGGLTYTYQWLRDGTAIAGATNRTYSIQGSDSTHLLSCKVTATNSKGSASATSAQTVPVP